MCLLHQPFNIVLCIWAISLTTQLYRLFFRHITPFYSKHRIIYSHFIIFPLLEWHCWSKCTNLFFMHCWLFSPNSNVSSTYSMNFVFVAPFNLSNYIVILCLKVKKWLRFCFMVLCMWRYTRSMICTGSTATTSLERLYI